MSVLPFPESSWWTKESISSVLGIVSIACWIVAQAPQFYENYVSQSCEGLALPFLVNWLAGDITNLVGCILTDQKEFQTWLAVYFCLIDLVLTGQYFYYARPTPEAGRPSYDRSLVAGNGDEVDHPASSGQREGLVRSGSDERNKGRRGGSAVSYHHHHHYHQYHHHDRYQGEAQEDQSLTEAALQVALAAERVERSRSRRRRGSGSGAGAGAGTGEAESGTRTGMVSGSRSGLGLNLGKEVTGKGRTTRGGRAGDGMSSFHSSDGPIDEDSDEVGGNVWDSSPGRGDQVTPGGSSSLSVSPSVTFQGGQLSADRGRASRTGTSASTSPALPRPSNSRSTSRVGAVGSSSPSATTTMRSGRRGSSTARRGPSQTAAGVVFMGVWMLAGVRWGSSGSGLGSSSRVLDRRMLDSTGSGRVIGGNHAEEERLWTAETNWQATEPDVISITFAEATPDPSSDDSKRPESPDDHSDRRRWDKPAIQRLIGRMSAWICTTLYLTSRLPQIWKNYQRKSVEGLSILLFVFAFCGNLTYVLSIVLNPTGSDGESNPEMTGYYLLEALPYLLGSGGTLVFDLTIMIQSLVYGSAPPIDERDQEDYIEPLLPRHRHHSHNRSRSSRRYSKRVGDEESRPLMDGDRRVEDER